MLCTCVLTLNQYFDKWLGNLFLGINIRVRDSSVWIRRQYKILPSSVWNLFKIERSDTGELKWCFTDTPSYAQQIFTFPRSYYFSVSNCILYFIIRVSIRDVCFLGNDTRVCVQNCQRCLRFETKFVYFAARVLYDFV